MTIMPAGYLNTQSQAVRFFTPGICESTTGDMLRDLVDRAFDGSARGLMVNLLETDLDAENCGGCSE